MSRQAAVMLAGFVFGIVLLHPISMVIEGLVHPAMSMEAGKALDVLSVHHVPMAVFFGLIGALMGLMNFSYAARLMKEKKRVGALEVLLPICAYCKKIRQADRPAEDRSAWHEVEDYIALKTNALFTHGMCPDCYDRQIEIMDREDGANEN